MKKIIVRADDLGYSKAVNYGILDSVRDGIIKNIGFMVNMPDSCHGYDLIKNLDVCLGLHVNICVGMPVSDPTSIKSLVQEDGSFKSSRMHRSSDEDIVSLSDAICEVEAQYHRFVEITNKKPQYFEAHAIPSKNLLQAIDIFGKRYNLKVVGLSLNGDPILVNGHKVYMHLESMHKDYDPYVSFKNMVANAHEDGYEVMICHPGYIDEPLVNSSSLVYPRMKEVAMLIDPEFKKWIEDEQINTYTFEDL